MFLANVVVPCLFKCKPELFRRLPLMLLCLISPQPLSAHNSANSALTTFTFSAKFGSSVRVIISDHISSDHISSVYGLFHQDHSLHLLNLLVFCYVSR